MQIFIKENSYSVLYSITCSPQLIDNMAVENNEEQEVNGEDDDGHTTEVKLSPESSPVCKVTDTLWLLVAGHLGVPELHLEYHQAGEGRNQGEQPGRGEKFVWGTRQGERSGYGTVSVHSYGYQHVVGGGQREGLTKLERNLDNEIGR